MTRSKRKLDPQTRALLVWLIVMAVLVGGFCLVRNLAPDSGNRTIVDVHAGVIGRLSGAVAVAIMGWIVLYSAAIRRLDRDMSLVCLATLIFIALVASVAGMALRAVFV